MVARSVIVKIYCLLALAVIICLYCYKSKLYKSATIIDRATAVSDVGNTSPSISTTSFIHLKRRLSSYIFPERNTSLILPQSPCNKNIFLVVVVCSAISNTRARDAIRKTWGHYAVSHQDTRIYFLVGRTSNETLTVSLTRESSTYADIIQEDFQDTYNNLTLKSVMLLKWINQTCGHAKYVMKTDDDMFIHLPNLHKFLKFKGHSKMLAGCLIKGAIPIKDRNSKWYVSNEMFTGREYPPYLSGTGYVFSGKIVPNLYRAALDMDFFYLEDIFITGMCASKIGIHPVDNEGFRYHKRSNDYCTFINLITAHRMTPEELLSIWDTLQSSTKCETSS